MPGSKYGISPFWKWLKNHLTKDRKICFHPKTHNEDWPDGGGIIVCDDCGMSKYVWEQGESSWQWIEDIPEAREEVKKGLEKLRLKDYKTKPNMED